MPKLIRWALAIDAIAIVCTAPCLLRTTPGTMMLFFIVGMPCFLAGFLCYVAAVLRDLRGHKVL